VRAAAIRPVRDHPESRARNRCVPVRLHEAVRAGAGRPGRVPARPDGRLRPDQGAGRAAGRALPLPLGRPPDRVAGGRVRRHPEGRQRHRFRPPIAAPA
jgi:hypothetical protein